MFKDELKAMIKPTFYKDVEIPGSLKHVLYGDSVSSDSIVKIKFKIEEILIKIITNIQSF